MALLGAREALGFPDGANGTDTLIDGVHYNLTTLQHWNYTLYSNGTLSNVSDCLLTFPPYSPVSMFDNGTFVNSTSCYSPIKPIGARAAIAIGLAALFGLGLMMILVCLAKHGRQFLPVEKRFYPIGRRWQWYWALFTCGVALISLVTNVDVDRYYLPELPIVLASFFWYLMQIGAVACVWEAVRHWGSWMERQFVDPDPFVLRQDDRRATMELYLPLFFYLWLWLNFFMVVPRSWTNIEYQRSPQQLAQDATPTATDARFKVGAFMLVVCWLTIVFSLRHSINHYRERNRGIINRAIGLLRFTPPRFLVLIPLALAIPAYQALAAFAFPWSPLNVSGNRAAIFAGGFAPSLLIVWIQVLYGLAAPNEDRELIRQRRVRGEAIDRELGGVARKPAWWRRMADPDAVNLNMRERIARNVRELGGGAPTARSFKDAVDTRLREEEEAAARHASPSSNPNAHKRASQSITGTINNSPNDNQDPSIEMIPLPSREATDLIGLAPGDFSGARAIAERYSSRSERRRGEQAMTAVSGMLFPGSATGATPMSYAARQAELMRDGPPSSTPPPPPYPGAAAGQGRGRGADRPSSGDRSHSAETTNSITAPPQNIKSMLDA